VRLIAYHLQRALRMSWRDTMLSSRIPGGSLQRAKRSLAGYAALKLTLNLLRAALFERVGAATRSETCDHEQDRHAFHLYIL
jgi:hypothetical protein